MVLDNWNVVYRVSFEGNSNLNDDFETKTDAVDYAKEHIDEKPTVIGQEVYIDEFGQQTQEGDPEVLFSWHDSETLETSEVDITADELEKELADFEASLEDQYSSDEFDGHESVEIKEGKDAIADEAPEAGVPVDTEDEQIKAAEESGDDCADLCDWFGCVVVEDEPEVCDVDPFSCDFSDISEDEATFQNGLDCTMDPVGFMKAIADELGISDEVNITGTHDQGCDEIPVAIPVEVVCDDCDEIPEVAAEDKVDRSFNVNFFDSFEDETPAEHVAKCHTCPECGKEICICECKKALEEAIVNNFSSADEYYDLQDIDFNGQDIHAVEKGKGVVGTCKCACKNDAGEPTGETRKLTFTFFPNEGTVIIKNNLDDPIEIPEKARMEKVLKKDLGVEESLNNPEAATEHAAENETENKTVNEFYDHEDHTIENEQELSGTDNAVVDCKVADVIAHCEDEKPVDCKGEERPLEKHLTEDTDIEKKFNSALAKAQETNKPVLYGYSNRGKYFALGPIEIENLDTFRKEWSAKHPDSTMLVAYPDKSFVESLEEADMTDVELAERLNAALEEKHKTK